MALALSPQLLMKWGVFRLPFLSGECKSQLRFCCFGWVWGGAGGALAGTSLVTPTSGMMVGFMGIVARRVVAESRHFKPHTSSFKQQMREVLYCSFGIVT